MGGTAGIGRSAGGAGWARLQPEPFPQRDHLGLRRRAKLGAQQLGVRDRVAQRTRSIARSLEGLHVPQRDPGVVGILAC